MKANFSLLESEPIGIGIYRIMYETNMKPEVYPSFIDVKDAIEEDVLRILGTSPEEARKDESYTMGLILRRKPQLGIYVPGDNYTLVITMSTAIRRLERSFSLEVKI